MKSLIKSIGLTMIATLLARFLGFLREILIAYKFGTSTLSDAFIVSFSIPELIISGFGAAIATLYIPLFFKISNKQKEDLIKKFNFSVSVVLILIAIIIITLFFIFPRSFIMIFASGFDEETLNLTIQMTRLIILSTFPIMLAYLYKAYAQIKKKFALATLLGCSVNVSVIFALLIMNSNAMSILAGATLLGNILYACLLYVLVHRDGFKIKVTKDIFNDNVKELGRGVLPICFSNLIYEINQIIDRNFASNLSIGIVSSLNYASKIINLITAVFGTSIASIVFPRITKIYCSKNEKLEAHELLIINIGILTILVPIAVMFCLGSTLIILLLFARGNFNQDSIIITSESLSFYSIGIIGFNLKAIWIRVFNARLDTRTPAVNSFIAVLINIILNFVFIIPLQHRGLALATGISSILTDVLLIWSYKKKNTYFQIKVLCVELSKIFVALIGFVPFFYYLYNAYVWSIKLVIYLIISFVFGLCFYLLILYFLKAQAIVEATLQLKLCRK